jgi:hypothetical protein
LSAAGTPIPASLRTLLESAVDYAGLYPPASLDLPTALDKYFQHRGSPHSWILSRFVVGVNDLAGLASLVAERNGSGLPTALAVVARPASPAADFGEQFAEDLKRIHEFHLSAQGGLTIDAVEVKTPIADPLEWLREFQHVATPAAGWLKANLFFEVGLSGDWERWMHRLRSEAPEAFGRRTGFKLRCGGLDKAAFPSAKKIAEFLAACKRIGGDWKATAGLHHPLPTDDAATGAVMHGFVNLFTAALVHQFERGESRPERLIAVLEDRDADSWSLSDDAMHWRDFSVKTSQIATARKHIATSFGSCSFDEPVDDLTALGWL